MIAPVIEEIRLKDLLERVQGQKSLVKVKLPGLEATRLLARVELLG